MFIVQFFYFKTKMCLAHVGDTLHAHEPGAAHAHVPEAPVLSGPQVHHLASVVGLLVHQPVAVHHVAGHAVGHAVAVHGCCRSRPSDRASDHRSSPSRRSSSCTGPCAVGVGQEINNLVETHYDSVDIRSFVAVFETYHGDHAARLDASRSFPSCSCSRRTRPSS